MTDHNQARLISGSVGKTLIRLTIPMIFGIVSLVTFNLVDTFFVGRLGTNELAALSFTFPVVLIINSMAMGLGIGASAVISRVIGEGRHQQVQRLTTDSLILSLLMVGLFVTAGLLTIDPVFRLLGASPPVLVLIKQYMQIWYPGVIFVVIPMVGNNAIRASGDSKTPGIIMMTAAGINFIFDPLFIFGIGPFPRLEIAGAALATVIARAMAMVVSLYVLCRRDRMLTCERVSFKTMIRSWAKILYIALPTAGTRIVIPLGLGVVTRMVAAYGPPSVAAFGVSSRIEFFAVTVVMALASILGPFVGQNWGAGEFQRVKQGVRYSSRFSMGWGLFLMAGFAIAAEPIASVFNDDPSVIVTVIHYLRIVPIGYGLQGVMVLSASALNVLHKPFHAAFLSIFQMFFLFIPLAYTASHLFEIKGIFGALSVSYLVSGTVAYKILNKIIASERKKGVIIPESKFGVLSD